MRRIVLVAGALALAIVPLTSWSPAFAAAHVICVGSPGGSCDSTAASITAAITAANANSVDDIISVGAGTYSDGPYNLNGATHAITLRGIGASTILTLPASATQQSYLSANHATVSNLKILMTSNASNDIGIVLLSQAIADHVTVDGAAASGGEGVYITQSTLTGSAIQLPVASSRAVYSNGGSTVTDTTITGQTGYDLSDPGATDNLSRLSIRADYQGVTLDSGTINLDDSVIDLGPGSGFGQGLVAANPNPGADPKTIRADHVTVVGGGTGAVGVRASSEWDTVSQASTVTLTNSIISGPATSLLAEASNDGTPGANSTATITASYSDYANTGGVIGAYGSGGVVAGPGNLHVDPHFVKPATGDYHLAPGSPVVDKGNPAAGGPATDRDGHARTTDGDGNGTKIADMGAYERPTLPDTKAPNTRITAHPHRTTTASSVRFAFASSEAGSRFSCKLDKGAYRACASPRRISVTKGKHVFSVRATDKAGNTDHTPATFTFKRVKKTHH
ncbi:MAG: exported protein of unknown function [Marmoricola sp.]|nr:exported protein of unknown function [Marmoricola sp.]